MSKIKVKTIYLIAIIVGGLIGLSIKSTYAMFTSSLEIDNPICMSTNLSTSDDIVDTMEVNVMSGKVKEVPITINNTSSSLLNYTVFYNSTSSDIEIGTNMSKTDSNSSVGTINTNTTKKVYVQIKNNSDSDVTITLGVISNSMHTDMDVVPTEELDLGVNLVNYINNLYTTSTKSTTAVNSITYNLASSVGLMNDRLGSSSTNINSGNIRYYGANPNNYIYFNCSDYSNQSSTTCELWRVIGVFNNKVKIMRNESIGNYSWDNKDTSTGAEHANGKNNWPDARLMKLLNSGYDSENIGGSLYWNSGSGSCYSGKNNATISCDFTSIGLKSSTRSLISTNTWPLLGHDDTAVYTDVMYNKERTTGSVYTGRSTSWTGKVAIPYASDYGYAVDLSQCKQTLFYYRQDVCTSNNWMKGILSDNSFLLTTDSYTSYRIMYVGSLGEINTSNGVYYSWKIIPVLYLNSDINVLNTTIGSSSNPFQILF